MLETLIFGAEIDKGSNILLLLGDVHAAACGIEIEGLRPFDASQGFSTACRPGVIRADSFTPKNKIAKKRAKKKINKGNTVCAVVYIEHEQGRRRAP